MQSTNLPADSAQSLEYIGRYQVLEVLGRGAMAVVYKAYDPNIDRTLAIKVLREEKCVDPEYRDRFVREARAAGNLSHPNIVTVYDVGEFNDRPYIVMEIVEGMPMDRMMKSGKQFELAEVLDFSIQLAQALHYAHKHGVVHRDIKPSNMIYQAKIGAIKITDFGIAHLESNDMTQQTQAGEVLGTPQYMSPEQVLGQPVDGRSDLFSVGVVMYQMVSGQKPFTGDTIASLLFQIATEEPKPLDKIAKHVPQQLRQIIDKLLRKQPGKRFQSGEELARVLTRLKQEAEEKGDSSRVIPLRVKWTLIMSLLVGSVLVIGLYFVYIKQYESMLNQAIDYGGSLAKFIANESAIPLLEGDTVAIEVIVRVAKQRNATQIKTVNNNSIFGFSLTSTAKSDVEYITIVDRDNIVRGHVEPGMVGNKYVTFQHLNKLVSTEELEVADYTMPNTIRVFEFAAPIFFKNNNEKIVLGRVHIGVSQEPLDDVVNVTILMMLALMASTIGAVIVIAWVFGLALTKPLSLLRRSMNDIVNGHYEVRINDQRKDEFGQLFRIFNRMAEVLQNKNRSKLDQTGDPHRDAFNDTTKF